MKYVLILAIAMLVSTTGYGQVNPLYSQYMQDASGFNPAYIGSLDMLSITLQGRSQWQQITGAPIGGVFSVHSPVPGSNFGLGLRLMHEQISLSQRMRFSPAASYKLQIGKGVLRAGLSANYNIISQRYNSLMLKDEGDAAFASNAENYWSVATGLYFSTNNWYIGASVPEVYATTFNKSGDNVLSRRAAQYTLHGGVAFAVNTNFRVKPNFLLNMPAKGAAYADLNLNVLFREVLEVGVSGRTNGTMAFLGRLQISNQLSIGYATDYVISSTTGYSGSSHELSAQFRFVFDKNDMPSPRFF